MLGAPHASKREGGVAGSSSHHAQKVAGGQARRCLSASAMLVPVQRFPTQAARSRTERSC